MGSKRDMGMKGRKKYSKCSVVVLRARQGYWVCRTEGNAEGLLLGFLFPWPATLYTQGMPKGLGDWDNGVN